MSQKHVLRTRFPGRVSARGHETTPDPMQAHIDALAAQVQFVDSRGQALPFPRQGRYQLLDASADARGQAVTSAATVLDQQLTGYAVGYPAEPVDSLIDFVAPFVRAPIYFDYVSNATTNAMPVVDGDAVGADGLPPVIVKDPNTHASSKLIFRGVRVPFTSYDKKIAAAGGLGVEAERQNRVAFGLNAIKRGRAARVIALMDSTHGGGHAVTVTKATDDPIQKFRAYITAIADIVGSLDYVRVLIGGTSWDSICDMPVLVGGSGGTGRQDVTIARLARGWNLRESNVRVTNHRVVSSVQGGTTATTTIVGGNQLWIFGAKDTPDSEDPSFLKTFSMPLGPGFYQVSIQDLGGDNEMIWIEYFERVIATNSSAADRLTLTFA